MSLKRHHTFPGVPQLILQRAYQQSPCFFVDRDYEYYLDELKRAADEFNCQIHAYLLQQHQVMLLATPYSQDGISQMMQTVNRESTHHINQTYGRADTLWEGAYLSSSLDAESYLLKCMCYLESLGDPQSTWSSSAHNTRMQADALIQPHGLYNGLATDDAPAASVYTALCETFTADEFEAIGKALELDYPLGNDAFRARYEMLAQNSEKELECVSCNMVY